jgi:hypothetical protein
VSLCTTAHPLHPIIANIFGNPISETTTRPNPRFIRRSHSRAISTAWPASSAALDATTIERMGRRQLMVVAGSRTASKMSQRAGCRSSTVLWGHPWWTQVRKPPSWPRSWANFSLLYMYSHWNARANVHRLGQSSTYLAAAQPHGLGSYTHQPTGFSPLLTVQPDTAPDELTRWQSWSVPQPAAGRGGGDYGAIQLSGQGSVPR